MGNLLKDRIEGINQFPDRKLRELLYILSSDDIQSPFIPMQLRYPAFDFNKQGKFGLKHE